MQLPDDEMKALEVIYEWQVRPYPATDPDQEDERLDPPTLHKPPRKRLLIITLAALHKWEERRTRQAIDMLDTRGLVVPFRESVGPIEGEWQLPTGDVLTITSETEWIEETLQGSVRVRLSGKPLLDDDRRPLISNWVGDLSDWEECYRLTRDGLTAAEGMLDMTSSSTKTRHSEDFRSVNWFGTQYSFTPAQAAIVRTLWRNWEQGVPEVGQDFLLDKAEVESKQVKDVFKNNAAWNTLIVSGATRGSYMLQAR